MLLEQPYQIEACSSPGRTQAEAARGAGMNSNDVENLSENGANNGNLAAFAARRRIATAPKCPFAAA